MTGTSLGISPPTHNMMMMMMIMMTTMTPMTTTTTYQLAMDFRHSASGKRCMLVKPIHNPLISCQGIHELVYIHKMFTTDRWNKVNKIMKIYENTMLLCLHTFPLFTARRPHQLTQSKLPVTTMVTSIST